MFPTKPSIRNNLTQLASLAVFGMVLGAAVPARAVLEVASLNYTIDKGATKTIFGTPTLVGRIGSEILLEAIVLEYTPGTKVTGLTAVSTNTDAVLSHASLLANTDYIIYDGQRVWERMSDGAGDITLNTGGFRSNLNAIDCITTPFDIENFDYSTLDYTTFAAVPGTLAANGLQAADVFVDLGTLMTGISLKDDGVGCATNGDLATNDGMYHARVSILASDEWFVINAILTATVTDTTGPPIEDVGNSPFVSQRPISIDAIPPRVTLLNSVPSVIYIAPAFPFVGESQGTSTNNPNNERTELHFTLLDKSADVTMIIEDSGGVTVVSFPVQNLNPGDHFFQWDGRNDAGIYQLRGKYSFIVSATDDVGNPAIVQTGQVRITGLFVEVTNLTMSPNPAPSDNGTGQVFTITTILFDVTMTGASQLELAEFGLDSPVTASGPVSITDPDRPHMLVKPHLLDASGNLIQIFGPDLTAGDSDSTYILHKTSNVPSGCGLPTKFYGRDSNWDTSPTGLSIAYTVGDGDTGNDWDTLMSNFYHQLPSTGNTLDVYTGSFAVNWIGNNIAPGTYIMEVQAELAGEIIEKVGTSFTKPECSDPDIDHSNQKYHAYPDPKGIKSRKVQSFIFVEEGSTVTGDLTPPQVMAVNPASGSAVTSGFVSDSNPVWVIVQDFDSGPSATSTFIELKGPDGALVPGAVANDGGSGDSMKFYYIPSSPVTIGGVYTINVIPVDQSNNVGSVQAYTFVVADSSVPTLQDVIVTSSGVPRSIFPINPGPLAEASEVRAILYPPLGGAVVDFANSTIGLTDTQGNSSPIYSGTMVRDASTNSLIFTLDAPLEVAGTHRVTVGAVSGNGSSFIYTVDFVTVESLDYINYPPTIGPSSSDTCMMFDDSAVNVTDTLGAPILLGTITATDPGAAGISALGFSGDLPAGSVFFGRAIQFFEPEMNFATFSGQLPVIRVHFDENDVQALPPSFDYTQDVEIYYHNGVEWKLAKNQTGVVLLGPFQDASGPVTQFYYHLGGITKSHEYYAIFSPAPPPLPPGAVPTATPGLTEPMKSTRAFSPDGVTPCGSPSVPVSTCARIFYMTQTDIANFSEVETNARIYNLRGDLVRNLETGTDIDAGNNYDNNFDPFTVQYFLDWDGRNEQGALVKNGVYVVAVEWMWTDPITQAIDRGTTGIPVAVVR